MIDSLVHGQRSLDPTLEKAGTLKTSGQGSILIGTTFRIDGDVGKMNPARGQLSPVVRGCRRAGRLMLAGSEQIWERRTGCSFTTLVTGMQK